MINVRIILFILVLDFEIISNLLVSLIQFCPVFVLNVITSISKFFYQPFLIESKGDLSNPACEFSIFIEFAIILMLHQVDTFFHFNGNEQLELSHFTHRIMIIEIFILPIIKQLLTQFKLYSVITCGNSFDIIINILVILNTLDVIESNDCEKEDEYFNWRYQKPKHLSFCLICIFIRWIFWFSIINQTCILNEKYSIFTTF